MASLRESLGFAGPSGSALSSSRIPDLTRSGAIRTEEIGKVYGPLPGDPDLPDPGYLGLAGSAIKDKGLGFAVGLGERLGLVEEGARQNIAEQYEQDRLGFLAGNPSAFRAGFTGLMEIGASAAPIVPAGAAGKLATHLGTSATKAAIGLGAVEGGLVGFGETADSGVAESLIGTAAGLVAGGLGGRFGQLQRTRKGSVPHFEEELTKIQEVTRRYLTSAGDVPEAAFERWQQGLGRINARLKAAEVERFRHEEALDAFVAATGRDKGELKGLVNQALTTRGGIDSLLPDELKVPTRRLREHLDGLSTEIVESDMVPDSLKEIIRKNRGVYMHLSHRVFDDPKYADWISKPENAERWFEAYDFFRQRNPDWTNEEIEAVLLNMVERGDDSALRFLGGRGVGRKDERILKHRKLIADPIRGLLGKHEDPYVNFLKSASYMSADLERHRMFKDLRKIFIEGGHAREGALPSMPFRHALPSDPKRAPLSKDLWFRDPALRDALQGLDEQTQRTTFLAINGAIKLAKTGLSVQTHSRNTFSGAFMLMMQGHLPWGEGAGLAARAAFGTGGTGTGLFRLSTKESESIFKRLMSENLLNQGVEFQDLKFFQGFIEGALTKGGPVGRGLKKVGQISQKLYAAEDDFWKVFMYQKEYARYKKALYGGVKKLSAAQEEELHKRATEVVRDTLQIYSRIPKALKKLRTFPLMGPFVSFPAEILRNVKNTLRLGAKELSDLNPAIRKIGAQRLMGTAWTLVGLPAALTSMGQWISGATREEGEALREIVAPWNENSQFMFVGREPGQSHSFVDLSFSDPYSYVKKPIIAMVRAALNQDQNGFEALWEGIKEFSDPFTSPEISVSEFLRATDQLQRKTGADLPEKTKIALYHAYKAVAPGTVLLGERILRSMDLRGIRETLPNKSLYGREYELGAELFALAGPRITTIDHSTAFRWRAKDYASARRDALSGYNSERKAGRSPYLALEARRRAEEINQRAGKELLRKIEAMKVLGMTDQQILAAMEGVVSKKDARELVKSGKIPGLRIKVSAR